MHARWLLLAALLACAPKSATPPVSADTAPPAPATAWIDPSPVDRERLRAHLAFLADDAQEGRPPGTAADLRVEDHIERAMRAAGLRPGFSGSYRQVFSFVDGVHELPGRRSSFTVGGKALAHDLVPFTHAGEPVSAPLVYVGHGIAGDDPDSGDYQGILSKVNGAIVVARGGGPVNDPHIDGLKLRAQSKVIAARDRGAIGFVLWEPEADVPYPNHGEANDLKLPAVAIARDGTRELLRAFGRKELPSEKDPHAGLRPGATTRGKASLHTPVERRVQYTANVAGLLPGTGRSRIVLGAHMDHLGRRSASSLAPGVDAIHNGADDNASGVAALLAIADVLARVPREHRPYDIQFVAFAAEEMGLYGSKHVVEALTPAEKKSILAMLNFDMVGRVRDRSLVVVGTGTSSAWDDLLARAAPDPQPGRTLTIKPSEDGFGASDQASYYAADIPVLHFFSGSHEDYHKPSDDLDKINIDGAAAVSDLAVRLVSILLRDQPVLDFKKIAAATPRTGGFRVSLGTVPEYGAQVDGMQLAGVRPGSPAEKAGLRKGDVVVKIGAREIHNIDDFMASFGELSPGVAVPIVVQRDGARVEGSITPAAPTRR